MNPVIVRKKRYCINGHDSILKNKWNQCKQCKVLYDKIYKGTNKEKIKQQMKQYISVNKIRLDEQKKEWNRKNQDRLTKEQREYRKEHPEIFRLIDLRHKNNRNLRIPNFGQEGIVEFYKNCPPGYQIDHVVPLCGRKASGLHVIWNLQYLPPSENIKKNNQFDGSLTNASWKLK